MRRAKLNKKIRIEESQNTSIVLTEAQFRELKQLLQSYLKVAAFGALRELTKTEIEKNTWLLHVAGFSQDEIRKILHTSPTIVNQILKGKYIPKRRRKEEEK
jgi:sulfur relay (sulfurtransferase) DsrF/TusC family protein